MLFEPSSSSSQKFMDLVLPRLAASDSERARFALRATGQVGSTRQPASVQGPCWCCHMVPVLLPDVQRVIQDTNLAEGPHLQLLSLQAPPQVYESSDDQEFDVEGSPPPPFELELLEAALMVATGRPRLPSLAKQLHPCTWCAARSSLTPLQAIAGCEAAEH